MEKKLKLCMGIIGTIALVSYYKYDHKYHPEYEIINEKAYATYRDGYIYIGDANYLNSISVSENDIRILDERDAEIPNMKIYDSYRISDKDMRNDILCVILEYDDNLSNYNRSIESMRVEWFVHNVCYYLNIEVDRTKDVDFANDEEEKYDNRVLRKIFKL